MTSEAKDYVCSRRVSATPMTRGAYNGMRGWNLPEGEDAGDEGFLVKEQGTDADHLAWMPKAAFERSHSPIMPPHQQRVVVEHGELVDRLRKLREFLRTQAGNNHIQPLCKFERARLQRQELLMCDLVALLAERIEAFE